MTSSKWVFTLNNPDGLLDDIIDDKIKYLLYAEETGETGNYHFQGMIHLQRSQRLSFLKKLIPTAHFEVQRGTNAEAIAYCKKGGDSTLIHEYGTPVGGQGTRSDLIEIKKKLDDGIDLKLIAQDDRHFGSWVRYHRSFGLYQTLTITPRTEIHSVVVIYGGTGLGKTTWVEEMFIDIYWVDRPNNGCYYFEGYEKQDCILIDDFYGWLPQDFLLRLCQPKELRLPYRGGASACVARNIIFTTNKTPWTWYKRDMSNFERRVTDWIFFTGYKTYYHTKDYNNFRCKITDSTLQ